MKPAVALTGLALPFALAACATPEAGAAADSVANAALVDGAGRAVGEAVITSTESGLSLRLSLNGIAPGAHGMHLHGVGICEGPAFTSAGPHLNPTGRQHGHDNPSGAHLGDLPNIVVGNDGRARLEVPIVGERGDLTAALFDGDGTAIVVHAKADDYRTDPSGNSGDRIACGVIKAGS